MLSLSRLCNGAPFKILINLVVLGKVFLLSIYLSVCQSFCLSVCRSVCLSTYLCLCAVLTKSVSISLQLSPCVSLCLSKSVPFSLSYSPKSASLLLLSLSLSSLSLISSFISLSVCLSHIPLSLCITISLFETLRSSLFLFLCPLSSFLSVFFYLANTIFFLLYEASLLNKRSRLAAA